MPAGLTPSFVFDLESRMRVIASSEYNRLTQNQWWTEVAREIPTKSKRELFFWLLETAGIEYVDRLGGAVEFEQLAMQQAEFDYKAATGGFKANRYELEDLDGGGVKMATEWVKQVTAIAAYWAQRNVASALRAGSAASSLTYDGEVFFSDAHPVNPQDSSLGTFSNNFTAGSGAGAKPLLGVTLDVAFQNLQDCFTYIRKIKMPNGIDPRHLKPVGLLGPPAYAKRFTELTDAKFIAAGGTGGAGSQDIEGVIRNMNVGKPIIADELAAGFGSGDDDGADDRYYILAAPAADSELGAINYINREPFSIVYNTGMADAELQRANELQWTTRGANKVHYGHPYLIFRCMPS